MPHIIVRDGVAAYLATSDMRLTEAGLVSAAVRDPMTTTADAVAVFVPFVPPHFVAGQWGYAEGRFFPLPEHEPALLEAARAEKLREINAAYEEALARVTADYPPSERLSFEKQEAEASAWTADGAAPTPFMDALAAGRGVDKATLARKILEKAALFATLTGALTGQRQRFEDETASARTLEAVDAVSPAFTLPGTEGETEAAPEQATGPDAGPEAEPAAPETAGGEG